MSVDSNVQIVAELKSAMAGPAPRRMVVLSEEQVLANKRACNTCPRRSGPRCIDGKPVAWHFRGGQCPAGRFSFTVRTEARTVQRTFGGEAGSSSRPRAPAVDGRAAVSGSSAGPAPQVPARFMRGDGTPVALQGLFTGQTAFLICGGPSLATMDLSPLRRPGVLTIGVNNSARVLRPSIWTCVDQSDHFLRSIYLDPTILKLLPWTRRHERLFDSTRWAWTAEQLHHCPNAFFFELRAGFDAATFLGGERFCWGDASGVRSVMLVALRAACELGVRRLVLVGADFHMKPERSYGFDERKDAGGARSNNHAYRTMDRWFAELRPALERRGMSVLNATEGSHLTAFDRVSLADAMTLAGPLDGIDLEKEPTAGLYTQRKPPMTSVRELVPEVVRLLRDERAPPRIPPIIHFAWLGSAMPAWAWEHLDRIRALHPRWEVRAYGNAMLTEMPAELRAAADSCELWCQRADVLRWWALHSVGGIWLDADIMLTRAIDPLRRLGAFASESGSRDRRPFNGIVGAAAGDETIGRMLRKIVTEHHQHGRPQARAAWGPDLCRRERSSLMLLPRHLLFAWTAVDRCLEWRQLPPLDQERQLRAEKWPYGLEPFGLHVFGLEAAPGVRSSFARVTEDVLR